MVRAKFLMVLCTLTFGCLLASQVEAAKGQLTEQEKYVLQQVAKGEWADLKEKFGGKEENRQLSARFLENLLTGELKVKVDRKGIWIKNAVIVDSLDLVLARIPHPTFLFDCLFKEEVFCRDAVFEKHFMINSSTFEKEGDFHRLKVKKNLFCDNATFQGAANFASADIGGQFSADGAKFNNEKEKANFNGLKVGQDVFLKGAEFHGPMDFIGADIGSEFIAIQAKFLATDKLANFNSLKVGHTVHLENATFQGPVEFVSAEIGSQFEADGAKFLSQEHEANLNALKVGQNAFFRNATFQGPVNFVGADIGLQFSADGAKFNNEKEKADFNGMKVGQHAFFDDATFQGPVDFAGADIGRQFKADGAKFLSQWGTANFEGMRVGQVAFFRNVTFKSDVVLIYGTYLDLLLSGAEEDKQEGPENLTRLSLKGTDIKRELTLENFKLTNLEAQHLRVKGPATFDKVSVAESADFQNANIATLKFNFIEWPKKKASLKLDGLTYTSLCVDELNNFPGLLGLVDRAAFDPQNYLELEKYCTRAGHQDWADETFIAMKDRELARMGWYNPGRWLIWLFWGRLAGYGRHPFRIFWAALLIIIIGAVVRFNPEYLEVDLPKKWHLNYQLKLSDVVKKGGLSKNLKELKELGKLWVLRGIISFDQFIPAIDLGVAKNWQPPELSFWAWFYVYFQKISGWILVPIGLAAIYSQFK